MKIKSRAIFGEMLGATEKEINFALKRVNHYAIKKIPKRSKRKKSFRTIYIPPKPLRHVQNKIKALFKRMKWACFSGIYGLYKKTSNFDHVFVHRNGKWWFQFDIQDAFPSVNLETVREIVEKKILELLTDFEWNVSEYQEALIRHENEVCEIWDDMTEYIHRLKRDIDRSIFSYEVLISHFIKNDGGTLQSLVLSGKEELARELSDLIMALTTYNGILPQGTPTAPFLYYLFLAESNLFSDIRSASHSDSLMSSQFGYQCSVYVDNFVISHQRPISEKIQKDIYKVLENYGLAVNSEKILHQGALHGAPLITGLRIINQDKEGKIVLSKKTVRKWRGVIHRAIQDRNLRKKVKGFIASIAPVYTVGFIETENLGKLKRIIEMPKQLKNPYDQLLLKIQQEETGCHMEI